MASDPTCSSGDFCAYSNTNLTGNAWTWVNGDSNWGNDYNNGQVASNNTKSWYNHGVACDGCDHVWLWDDTGAPDVYVDVLYRGEKVTGTGDRAVYDRRASSHNWGGVSD